MWYETILKSIGYEVTEATTNNVVLLSTLTIKQNAKFLRVRVNKNEDGIVFASRLMDPLNVLAHLPQVKVFC